jgi:hypothetical protein
MRVLAVAFLARSVVNAAFAIWLVTGAPGWDDVFRAGSFYAFADGTLALLTAIYVDTYATHDAARLLGGITFADGAARVAAAICIRVLPGLPGFPVATVAFFGALGAGAATLGVSAVGLWVVTRWRTRGHRPTHPDALFDPLALAALISFVVCGALFVRVPDAAAELRVLAGGATAALALVFFVAFVGATTHHTDMSEL